jgi:uncharacterized protein
MDDCTAPASHAASPLALNGAELVADPSGALYWPAARTLIVADLHLEKASSYALRGVPLPPYDTRATLAALRTAVRRHAPERVICLGDSFHDAGGPARLDAADAAALDAAIHAVREWIWIAGNHDPAPARGLGGRVVAGELPLGSLLFRHAAAPDAAPGEVSGHYHPKASVAVRGRRVTGRCFVADGRRLVMPAFGALAGGLDVFDPALAALFPGDFRVHLIGRRQVTPLARARLAHT